MDPVKNFARVGVSTGYDDAAVSIALASGDGAKLPQPSTDGEFNLAWWNSTDYPNPSDDPNVEIVRVTARSTDTLTVTRAQEDTSASTKNTADKVYKMILGITKKTIDEKINRDETDASGFGFFKDEDDMASDSDEAVASQQSIKAYSDGRPSINNLLKNGNFINASTNGYGGTPDDWEDDGNANPVQGGFPSMTKQQLIDLLGVTDANIEGIWNLNGNFTDLSSNGYDLTAGGTPTDDDDGLMAQAKGFQSAGSDYAEVSGANLRIAGSQTFIAFVKPQTGFAIKQIMTINDATNYFGIRFDVDGKGIVDCSGVSPAAITSDIVFELNKWNFICGIYDSANAELRLWINGVKKVVTGLTGSHTAGTGNLAIGRNPAGASQYFDGLIQNACVINGALTDTQVKKLWAYTTYKGTKIRRDSTNGYLSQDLPQNLVESLRGKDVSIVSKMYQDTASIGTVEIDDGGTPAESTAVATVDEWLEMGVTKTIDSDAQQIQLKLKASDSDGNVWFKEVAVYEGSTLVYTWYPSYDDVNRLPRLLDMNPPAVVSGYQFEEGREFDWIPDLTIGAADLGGYTTAKYKVVGCSLNFWLYANNYSVTGSAGAIEISLPASGTPYNVIPIQIRNGSNNVTSVAKIDPANSKLLVYKTPDYGNWATGETGVDVIVSGIYNI